MFLDENTVEVSQNQAERADTEEDLDEEPSHSRDF